jgi:hypothetical protein
MDDLPDASWRTSTRSGSQGDCVEVNDGKPGVVGVRDSKNRTGGTLVFPAAAWRAFIDGLKVD